MATMHAAKSSDAATLFLPRKQSPHRLLRWSGFSSAESCQNLVTREPGAEAVLPGVPDVW